MRDELKLPQESVLWSHFTKSQTCEGSDLVGTRPREMKGDVLIEDKDKIPRAIIRSLLDCFNEMGFTETSRILEKKIGYFSKGRFEELVHSRTWTLLEEYLSRFLDIDESALLSKIKTWAFMDNLKRRGLPLPEPKWSEPDYKQKESIISVLPELIQGKLKTRDELKLPQESDLWRSFIWSRRLTYEYSDLIGVHRRPPEERKVVYKKFKKMTIFDTILVKAKSIQVREGVYENRPAMIKCIDLDDKVAIREKELSNLMELEGHENVVKYYGVEWDKDSCFIALEMCSFTLHDLFDKEKNFWNEIKSTWDPADDLRTMLLNLIKDIIKGLEYLHSHHLIHRGLNPSNIMIKKECGKFRAKLSNMGSSKRLGGTSSTTNTPNNPDKGLIDDDDDKRKAPEQKENDKKVGRYVDLYSLGYIIHFCLTEGRHPEDVGPTSNLENYPIEELLFMLVEDFPEAYDIVSQLMSPQKNNTPSAKQVLKHIFLWDSTKRNLFMRHASDRLHKETMDRNNSDTESPILELHEETKGCKNSSTKSPILELERMKGCIFNGRSTWDVEIDRDFSEYLKHEKRQPKDNDKGNKFESSIVYSLVRLIRNKSGNFHDLPENVLNLIPGTSANRIEEYFIKKFLRLFLEVYKIVLKFSKSDPTLKPYFA